MWLKATHRQKKLQGALLIVPSPGRWNNVFWLYPLAGGVGSTTDYNGRMVCL